MLIAFWSTGVRLLLSLTLLVNGIGNPAFQHAHAVGDELHSHDATAGHSHSHDHDCADHHHATSETADQQLTNSVAHLHASCFGIDFAFPVQNQSNQSDREFADSAVAFAKLHDECVQASSFIPAFFHALLVPGIVDSINILPSAARFSVRPPVSPPLCDIARHERSGVLLS